MRDLERVSQRSTPPTSWPGSPWAAQWPTPQSRIGPHAVDGRCQGPPGERVKARLQWLMADPAVVTDDLIKTRQVMFQQPTHRWSALLRFGDGFVVGGERRHADGRRSTHPGQRGFDGALSGRLGAPRASAWQRLLRSTSPGLDPAQFESWEWRLPFLPYAVPALVRLMILRTIAESPEVEAGRARDDLPKLPSPRPGAADRAKSSRSSAKITAGACSPTSACPTRSRMPRMRSASPDRRSCGMPSSQPSSWWCSTPSSGSLVDRSSIYFVVAVAMLVTIAPGCARSSTPGQHLAFGASARVRNRHGTRRQRHHRIPVQHDLST